MITVVENCRDSMSVLLNRTENAAGTIADTLEGYVNSSLYFGDRIMTRAAGNKVSSLATREQEDLRVCDGRYAAASPALQALLPNVACYWTENGVADAGDELDKKENAGEKLNRPP